MKCRTCYAITHHARQCDDCTRQAGEDLGVIALDEQGSMPRRRIPWALVAAVLAALATGAGYVATHQQAPQFVAVD